METKTGSKRTRVQKVLLGTTVATLLACALFIIAVATNYWALVDMPGNVNITNADGTGYILAKRFGIWRICDIVVSKSESKETREECRYVGMSYPTRAEYLDNPATAEIDQSLLDYNRTATIFAVISMTLILLGHAFAVYSMRKARYMFKRLAGFLHIMSAGCILVTIEVFVTKIYYKQSRWHSEKTAGSHLSWGFSVYLAWVSFAIFVAAGLVFFICSRKKKGDDTLYGEDPAVPENEPVRLGRL